jgi:cobalt-zinc-cadmium efflux system outer membrane protein
MFSGELLVVYKIVSASLSVLLMLGATGCGAYRRKPIVDRQVLRDLQAIRLEGLGEVEGKPDQKAPKISSSEGLSADEAVVVALYLNPDLRAFRKEKGVAEGELLTARQFPNPEIQASVLANLPGSGVGIGANTLAAILSPLRPGERGARVALAQARIEEIKSQVSAEEWRFTAEVKKGYLTLWASEEQLKIQDTSVRLQERIMKFFRDKRDLGDASRLDLNLVNLEYTQALLQREAATNERDRARQALLAVLGLPPLYNLKLKAATDPIAYKPFQVEPATLETFMIERRPQLAAAKQEYEQAEQTLRLAYIQRIPWFRLGPSYERESGGGEGTTNRLGLGVGIDLPLFNRNQGAIVSLEAARDKLREGFTAKVHTARVKMNEAYRSLRAQERLIRLYQDSIKPTLEENAELTESGFQLGEFNLIQLITTQDKVLASRREFVASELEYWKAAIDLEAAIGAPLSEAEANKKQP